MAVQGLNCTCKQVENSQILYKNHIDILAVQERWEVTGKTTFSVQVIYGLESLEVKIDVII